MSIATLRGDGGETSLAGGIRVRKDDARVETYGAIDELISALGFARAICQVPELCTRTKQIQRELFKVGSAIATPSNGKKTPPEITSDLVDALTADVHRIEAIEGVLGDWSIPGEDAASAAFDVARSICRRAERQVVTIRSSVEIQDNVLRYLNRLSDVLWLFSRLIEHRLGLDARLRDADHAGPRWSRAW
jgi:cob(I)alamin adenosyltransferase